MYGYMKKIEAFYSRIPAFAFLTALTLALTAGVAEASNNRKDIPRWKRKSLPNLYSITLGKPWDDITESQPSNVDFAARTRRPQTCGEDTFLTIQSDYKVQYAYEGAFEYLDRLTPRDVTTQLAQKFYPHEVREVSPPELVTFSNDKPAYRATYRLTFSDGKRYAVRYYLTFQSGYAVHVMGYSLGRDVLRAEGCFEKLLKNLTFNNLKPM
jgi:hypothetical protein